MLARPFVTRLHPMTDNGQGNVLVIVQFHGQPPLDTPQVESLQRPFVALSRIGQWGALAGCFNSPNQSSLPLLKWALSQDLTQFHCLFSAKGSDPGLFFMIQNLVHFIHDNIAAVQVLEIHSSQLTAESGVAEELPGMYEPCPFLLNYEMESAQVCVDVDFTERWNPAFAESFRTAWEAWYDVAFHGGFCSEDYLPGETSIFIEDDLQITSTGLGAVYSDVTIDDAGFKCLINMLQVFHSRVCALAVVTLE